MSSFIATLTDGTTITEENLNKQSTHFGRVLEADKARTLESFRVFLDDGSSFAVNLLTGQLEADGSLYTPEAIPSTPLRIIYYKTMRSAISSEAAHFDTVMYRLVVGWQTTVIEDGVEKNIKVGVSVYPMEARYEVTGDI